MVIATVSFEGTCKIELGSLGAWAVKVGQRLIDHRLLREGAYGALFNADGDIILMGDIVIIFEVQRVISLAAAVHVRSGSNVERKNVSIESPGVFNTFHVFALWICQLYFGEVFHLRP